MGFVEETDCKLSVGNGSPNAFSTYKIKNIFLRTRVGKWDRGPCPLDFEIWYFSITFSAKKFVLRRKN